MEEETKYLQEKKETQIGHYKNTSRERTCHIESKLNETISSTDESNVQAKSISSITEVKMKLTNCFRGMVGPSF